MFNAVKDKNIMDSLPKELSSSLSLLPKSCSCSACKMIKEEALKEQGQKKFSLLADSLGILI